MKAPKPSLLYIVQSLIDRLYAHERSLPDAAGYVIGDRGFDRLYGSRLGQADGGEPARAGSGEMLEGRSGAQVLMREHDGRLRLAIYFPDPLISWLERHDPRSRLDDHNVDAFLAFVEELDHFRLISRKWCAGREFSLLELELHANMTKFILSRYFRKLQRGRIDHVNELWVGYHLFHKGSYLHEDPTVVERYEDARRLAFLYSRNLLEMTPQKRLQDLRRWSRASHHAKVARIAVN